MISTAGEQDSRTLWEHALPQQARMPVLPGWRRRRSRLGSIGVCGTLGWYDYSARAPHLPFAAADYRRIKPLFNHDADYIDWPWSDRAMARYLQRGFARRLAALEQDAAVSQIVVATHMPIFPAALPDYPESERYSIQRAFLGNFTLGDLVSRTAKVTHVVSGHLHRSGAWQVQGLVHPIDFQVIGSRRGSTGRGAARGVKQSPQSRFESHCG
jgi:hypothetical protein